MFVKNLVGAFSKFHLAGRTIKGVPCRPEGRRHQSRTPVSDGLTVGLHESFVVSSRDPHHRLAVQIRPTL
jgi:hypothetical protein